MIKKYIAIFTVLFLVNVANANDREKVIQADAPPNNCVYLSVQISNNTNANCLLIDKQVMHGRMSANTQAPVLIQAGDSAYPFEMRQQIYGPDIVLTYECGEGNQISFESQQDFCILKAGEISGNVLYTTTNLAAKSTKDRGSYLWNRHGAINWLLYTK
jgi:hypothetical protein